MTERFDREWDRSGGVAWPPAEMPRFGADVGRFAGRGPRGYKRSDERIKEDVCELLALDGWIDASDIEVEVRNGEVIFTGAVQNRADKRRAEYLADRVACVRDIHNQLRIQASDDAMAGHATGAARAGAQQGANQQATRAAGATRTV
jgi:hypothetical protein